METYEVHITVEPDERTSEGELRQYAEASDLHYSKIKGWDELGEGTRAYLTWHVESDDLEQVKRMLHERIHDVLIMGFNVVRGKIEACVYDWRR